jgi:hypothetical protein
MRFRLPISFPHFNIDWPNHIIAFFSALFGILIAFELDEWRERRKEQELAQSAFANLRNEVGINKNLLHENIRANLQVIRSLQGVLPSIDKNLVFHGSTQQADSINKKFGRLIFVNLADSIQSGRQWSWPVHFGVGNISIPSLQVSAWESAKATGALNFLPYERVLSLSFVYNDAKIIDELAEIRNLWRNSDGIKNKSDFTKLLSEMEKSHQILERELVEFDQFVNMLEVME